MLIDHMYRHLLILDIYLFNLQKTNDIRKKELFLNTISILFDTFKPLMYVITFLLQIDLCFSNYLEAHKLEHLQLLSYHLCYIANLIKLDKKYILTHNNGEFSIVSYNTEQNNIQRDTIKLYKEEEPEEDLDIEKILNLSLDKNMSWADN